MLRVDQRIEELAGLTFREFGIEVKRPKVSWDVRGFSAGVARCQQGIMSLNPVFAVENPDEFVEDTIGHEWGHFAQVRLFPRATKFRHGKQWQTILRALGVPINIDHRYSVRTIIDRTPITLEELKGLQVNLDLLDKEELIYQEHILRLKA